MIATAKNIKPIFVINPDESVDMYLPNEILTNLIKTTPTGEQKIFKMQCRKKAYWMIERTRIQKAVMPLNEKFELITELNEQIETIKISRWENLKTMFGR